MKKIIASILALAMTFSMSALAFAHDDETEKHGFTPNEDFSYNTENAYDSDAHAGTTLVEYTIDEKYIAYIPACYDFTDGLTTTGDVVAKGVVLEPTNKLTVTLTSANWATAEPQNSTANSFKMIFSETSCIPYSIKNGDTAVKSGDVVLTVKSTGETSDTANGGVEKSVTLTFATDGDNIKLATKAGRHTDVLTFAFAIVEDK